MELEEFAKLAAEKFGDKVVFSSIKTNQSDLDLYNAEIGTNYTVEDFENYKQVWVVSDKCPNCDADLLGMFGSFEWGIVHGVGTCRSCNKVSLQYYHYIGNNRTPLKAMALDGF